MKQNKIEQWLDDKDIWKIVRIQLSKDRYSFFFLIKMILFFKKKEKNVLLRVV